MYNPRYENSVSRLSVLVEHIYEQAKTTDKVNSSQSSHRLIENNNLFSQHLFSTQSDKISHYVEEVKTKLDEFSRLYSLSIEGTDNTIKAELAKSSLHQIEQQVSALMSALHANQSMHQAAQNSFDVKKSIRAKYAKKAQERNSERYNKMAQTVLMSSHQLYQQLNEHHEFERRLLNMIADREQQRVRAKNMKNDKNSIEILTLHQRLGRCRKAISDIERKIELSEKSNLR